MLYGKNGTCFRAFTETSGYGVAIEIFVKRFGKYRIVYSNAYWGKDILDYIDLPVERFNKYYVRAYLYGGGIFGGREMLDVSDVMVKALSNKYRGKAKFEAIHFQIEKQEGYGWVAGYEFVDDKRKWVW